MADESRETDNVHFLAGQVHALVGVCIAVINNHPSPSRLGLHLDAYSLATMKNLTAIEMPARMAGIVDR